MFYIQNLIIIFIQILILAIFISSSGFLFRKFLINVKHTPDFEEDGLFGFILIGFLALILNFFLPLSILNNSIFFILIFLLTLNFGYLNQNKKILFKKTFFISLIAFVLLLHSTVNRPDAWLYHLPYSKILNEHKIILGVSNIHSRFAHISIFQYVSSFFYNLGRIKGFFIINFN